MKKYSLTERAERLIILDMKNLPPITPNRFVMSPAESYANEIGHFIPRRTHDRQEARRRRGNAPGSLIIEEQTKGLEIIKKGLLEADNFSELTEWSAIAAPSLVGTSQYHLNGDIMHRHIPLPMLASHNPATRPNIDNLRQKALDNLDTIITYSDFLLSAKNFASQSKYRHLALRAGRKMAHTALLLEVLPLSEITSDKSNHLDNKTIQKIVRRRSLEVVQRVGDIALEIGVIPSSAQLPDPISPLSVELQRSASDAVDRIYSKSLT